MVEYLAHISRDGQQTQTVLAHLEGTARLAAGFAAQFGAEEEGRRCGMLHDAGKYSAAFQRRILGSNEQVDHSTAGAAEAAKQGDVIAAFCVAGHHGGLPDGGTRADGPNEPTLHGKLNRAKNGKIEPYDAFHREAAVPEAKLPRRFLASTPTAFFFTRMLYSCLVDADFLDTEAFMQNGCVGRGGFPPIENYLEKLSAHTAPWLKAPKGELGEKRSEILRAAIEKAAEKPGLFNFTAPTGSGKTLASMSFALHHARANGLRRVIYVIPYCSIIEQTQAVFENIFGESSIVAHYADVEYQNAENKEGGPRDHRYLAAENWDAPVVLTTTVQFFESLFANKPSRCRKLHNLAGSVLIFDEAQMLPVSLLRPCVAAIAELVKNYGCSAVLCTATQPALEKLFAEEENLPHQPARELCPRREELYEQFRRVRYENLGRLAKEELARRLAETPRVLCIVNRRDEAKTLFEQLPQEGRFHLSTAMCPADRRAALEQIRRRLKEKKPCRVISTSLIEAGVDVDFPMVYRELAGLDSIIQAGGRCNREGIPGVIGGVVYVFESERKPPRMLAQNIAAAKAVLHNYEDIASPQAVKAYFNELYYVAKGSAALDEKEILKLCASAEIPFATVSERFLVIEQHQFTVFIPKKENEALMQQLQRFGPDRGLMRKLGKYAVSVYPEHYRELRRVGALSEIGEDAAVLADTRQYHEETGFDLTLEEGTGLFL